MESGRFTLTELAQRSRVTPRTVHFYIQQGLLKPAGSPGPGAKYDEGHIARLRLIRRLQREHLPLAEIRKRLDGMDDEMVRAAVYETSAAEAAAPEPAAPPADEPASALDYVRLLLSRDRSSAWRSGRPASQSSMLASRLPAGPSAAADSVRGPLYEWPVARQPAMPTARVGPATPAEAAEPAEPAASAAPPVRTSVSSPERTPVPPPAQAPSSAPRPAAAERSQWERYTLAPDIELHVRRPLSRDQNRRVERLLALAPDIFNEELP